MSLLDQLGEKISRDLNPIMFSCHSIWSREMLDNKIEEIGEEGICEEYGLTVDEIDRIFQWLGVSSIYADLKEKFRLSLEKMLSTNLPNLKFCFDNWNAADYWSDFIREMWDESFDPDFPEVDWFFSQGIRSESNDEITEDEISILLDLMYEWITSEEVAEIFIWFHDQTKDFRSTIKLAS